MKTIRRNNKKALKMHVAQATILAVYKGDGYYPINSADVEKLIDGNAITSASIDQQGRLDMSFNQRDVGQYIVGLPSLAYAKTHLFEKDYARLHPTNELALRSLKK